MKNIEILKELQGKVSVAHFLTDDISVHMELEEVDLHDLLTERNVKIVKLMETIDEIHDLLSQLTEDVRSTMIHTNFDFDDYDLWHSMLHYDSMRLVELMDTFEEAHGNLDDFLNETLRGYKILNQEGTGKQD